MTENPAFIFGSPHDLTQLVQMSPLALLGLGTPDMDSCFLWRATLLEAICLNMESLKSTFPHCSYSEPLICLRLWAWQTPEKLLIALPVF